MPLPTVGQTHLFNSSARSRLRMKSREYNKTLRRQMKESLRFGFTLRKKRVLLCDRSLRLYGSPTSMVWTGPLSRRLRVLKAVLKRRVIPRITTLLVICVRVVLVFFDLLMRVLKPSGGLSEQIELTRNLEMDSQHLNLPGSITTFRRKTGLGRFFIFKIK